MDGERLARITQLLSIESTADRPDDIRRAVDMMAAYVEGRGLTVERFESNGKPSLLAYWGDMRPDTFRVILNGHVDVVPGKPDQFVPVIKDGNLYARGALDMKVAAMVMAEVVGDVAPTLPYGVALQIVSDEETGGSDGTGYQLQRCGVSGEFMIAGEFTWQDTICTAMRGICWVDIEFSGVSAHAAYLWQGDNAVQKACRYAQAVVDALPVPTKEQWCTTVNVAGIVTNTTARNAVPDRATLRLDIRYIPGDERFASTQAALAFLQSFDPAATVHLKDLQPCHVTDDGDANVAQLQQAYRAVTGRPAGLVRKHGGADVRYMTAIGKPSVAMGLQGEHLHGDGEYVELDSVQRYYEVLMYFLQHLDAKSS